MATVDLYNIEKQKVGEIDLNEAIFNTDVKEHLFYEVVKMQLSNRRRGTASTKIRKEVRGGGRKPWRQKGTGRARVGSIRSPIWKGGGVVFGPRPRSYSYQVPKKVRKAALRSALSKKFKEDNLLVLDQLTMDKIKTQDFVGILNNLELKNALFILADKNEIVEKSARNIPKIKVLRSEGINVFDILKYRQLVMTKDTVAKIETGLLP
jgi:large subunit ribosomal protein L4